MPGLLAEQREFSDGQDLNHIMPGKPYGKISQVYAYNLIDRITQHFDFLIDLHTASQGRVNSLYVRADLKQRITAQMAFLLNRKSSFTIHRRTTRFAAQRPRQASPQSPSKYAIRKSSSAIQSQELSKGFGES